MESTNSILNIFKGIGIAFLFTIIALVILSALLVYTNLSEDIIEPVIITITGISILIGSSLSTRKIRKNGMLSGIIIGISYILIIYLISSGVNSSFKLNIASIIMILVGLIGGIIGGIVGINTKNN